MTSEELVTREALIELALTAGTSEDPLEVANHLVELVDQRRLANPDDSARVLRLACAIVQQHGELSDALLLSERALASCGSDDRTEQNLTRAQRAVVLVRLDRVDEGTAEFSALRPQLMRDPDLADTLTTYMCGCGMAQLVHEWVTAALETILERCETVEPTAGALYLIYSLATTRRWLRADLDLPLDSHDMLADRLMDAQEEEEDALDDLYADSDDSAVSYYPDDSYEDDSVPKHDPGVVLWWPKPEFNQLLLRWPEAVALYGKTWDEHRAKVQRTAADLDTEETGGVPGLKPLLVPARVSTLADVAEHFGVSATDPILMGTFQLRTSLDEIDYSQEWPPGRNAECWCGSGKKYKKCCMRRL